VTARHRAARGQRDPYLDGMDIVLAVVAIVAAMALPFAAINASTRTDSR